MQKAHVQKVQPGLGARLVLGVDLGLRAGRLVDRVPDMMEGKPPVLIACQMLSRTCLVDSTP